MSKLTFVTPDIQAITGLVSAEVASAITECQGSAARKVSTAVIITTSIVGERLVVITGSGTLEAITSFLESVDRHPLLEASKVQWILTKESGWAFEVHVPLSRTARSGGRF